MKRILILASLVFLLGVPVAEAKLRIVAATNDLAAIAQAVCGDRADIEVVARPDRDPHTLAVRPSTMRETARADVYLEVGLDLDLWSAEIINGSRNRNLRRIDCSSAIHAAEVPTGRVDASLGDVHPRGNPHYWLDPLNGIAIADMLASEFSRIRPDDSAAFTANAAAFDKAIRERMPAWEARLHGASFVEYHRTWVYLAQRFDLHIVGQVEPLPGIPPTARHLTELCDVIRQTGATVVARDYFHSESPLEFLQRETGIHAVLMPSMCEEATAESYLKHFDRIADALGGSMPSGANGVPGEGK